MSITADCHLHTAYSADSDTPMQEMVERAIALGLKEICFTEHMDYDFRYTEDETPGCWEVNTDAYLYELLRCRERYAGRIKLLFGVELGLQSSCQRKNVLYAKSHDFDFIIASSHLVDGLDPWLAEEYFAGRTQGEAYHAYFRYIYDCIRGFENFDVYGHLDYVLRYGPTKNRDFRYEEYQEDIDKILKRLIENGKGIEANTSGYAYGMGGPHPCREILSRYRELGGEILTIGSDAHDTAHMAQCFDDAAALLRDIGFSYYCVFENRLPEYHRL